MSVRNVTDSFRKILMKKIRIKLWDVMPIIPLRPAGTSVEGIWLTEYLRGQMDISSLEPLEKCIFPFNRM